MTAFTGRDPRPAGAGPAVRLDRIAVGDPVPVLRRTIELADMVAYAGATWDWHRLHYDPGYVAARGLPAPVVDGQVFGALLAEQVQDWLGPRAELQALHFRFKGMVFAGETVRCTGTVTGVQPVPGGGVVITVGQRVDVVPSAETDADIPAARTAADAGNTDDAEGPGGRVAVAPAGATVVVRP